MFKKADKKASRAKRHLRVRKKVSGTPERPRLSASASTLDKEVDVKVGGNKEAAKLVGELVAKRALDKGITEVVFDRGGYVYHGRVQTLAESAREAGLKF